MLFFCNFDGWFIRNLVVNNDLGIFSFVLYFNLFNMLYGVLILFILN